MLQNPDNLRDLLRLLAVLDKNLPGPDQFDCAERTIEADTFVRDDFSHGVTDLLIRLPFRTGNQEREWIKVYLLFEHLSAHQTHIVPRTLGYAMDAYRLQERRWREKHETLQSFRYEVVVPIVIYTGERNWEEPTAFRDLVAGGDLFDAYIPAARPLFLSLPRQSGEELVQNGGILGLILRLVKNRHDSLEEFRPLLIQSVQSIERQLNEDAHRLRELLSYLTAMVYHFREKSERDGLRDNLEHSVQKQPLRREIHEMGQTIAEALIEEGELRGEIRGERRGELTAKQQTLLLQLRRKFGETISPAVEATIKNTTDLLLLDEWLGKLVDSSRLDEIVIPGT